MKHFCSIKLIVFIIAIHQNLVICHKNVQKSPLKVSKNKLIKSKNLTQQRDDHSKTSYVFKNFLDSSNFYDMLNPNHLNQDYQIYSGFNLNPFAIPDESMFNLRLKAFAESNVHKPSFILPYVKSSSSSKIFYDPMMSTSNLDFSKLKKSPMNDENDFLYNQRVKQRGPNAEKIIEEHIFDPELTKYFLKQKEKELASNDLIELNLNDFKHGNELAQNYLKIYNLNSLNKFHSSDQTEFFPLPSSPLDISSNSYSGYFSEPSFINEFKVYPSFNSISTLSAKPTSTSFSSSYQSLYQSPLKIKKLSAIPFGAIVGAPGSSPPPGMKLAGYVTMAKLTSSIINPKTAHSVNSPVIYMDSPMSNKLKVQSTAKSMTQNIKYPYTNRTQDENLHRLIDNTNSQVNNQIKDENYQKIQNFSSKPRFLKRLNLLNLFKNFRLKNVQTISNDYTDFEDREEKLTLNFLKHYKAPKYKIKHIIKKPNKVVQRKRRYVTNSNDTETAENEFFPFSFARGFHIYPERRERDETKKSRGPRRFKDGPIYYTSETQNYGLMGSGNFEVIRGGILPPTQNKINIDRLSMKAQSVRHSDNIRDDNAFDEDEDDDKDIFSSIDEDYFSGLRPGQGILGFQGFNHFVSRPVFNPLSASNQKLDIKKKQKF